MVATTGNRDTHARARAHLAPCDPSMIAVQMHIVCVSGESVTCNRPRQYTAQVYCTGDGLQQLKMYSPYHDQILAKLQTFKFNVWHQPRPRITRQPETTS